MTKPSANNPSGQPLGLPLNDGLGALVDERVEIARLEGDIRRREDSLRRKQEILLELVQIDEDIKGHQHRISTLERRAKALLREARQMGVGGSA